MTDKRSMDDIFVSSAGHPSGPAHAPGPSASSKSAFDDLDDDFEGLEDAKEGSADDDFASISRSGLDDFNPVFDSSPPQSQAAKSDSTQANTHFGGESSFDFASLSTGSTTGSATAVPTNAAASQGHAVTAQTTADSHDWDAIFASLDDAPSAGVSSPAPAPAPASAATGNSTAKEPVRPNAPGRALTEAGEHDDPILKNLTSMGYSRADALLALEKYDYNLERAANYLASQS
jgi:epidermal growth factor receptor substrate 15